MKYGNTSKILKALHNSCIVWSRFLWRPSTWLHSNSPTRAQNTPKCSWLSWHVATHLGTIPLVPSNLLPSLYNWDTWGCPAQAQLQSLSLHREAWEFQAPQCKLKSDQTLSLVASLIGILSSGLVARSDCAQEIFVHSQILHQGLSHVSHQIVSIEQAKCLKCLKCARPIATVPWETRYRGI